MKTLIKQLRRLCGHSKQTRLLSRPRTTATVMVASFLLFFGSVRAFEPASTMFITEVAAKILNTGFSLFNALNYDQAVTATITNNTEYRLIRPVTYFGSGGSTRVPLEISAARGKEPGVGLILAANGTLTGTSGVVAYEVESTDYGIALFFQSRYNNFYSNLVKFALIEKRFLEGNIRTIYDDMYGDNKQLTLGPQLGANDGRLWNTPFQNGDWKLKYKIDNAYSAKVEAELSIDNVSY